MYEQESTIKLWKYDDGKYRQLHEGEDAVTCWMYADQETAVEVNAPTDIEYKNEMGLMVQSIIEKQNEGPVGISYNDSVVSPLINAVCNSSSIDFIMVIPQADGEDITQTIGFTKNSDSGSIFVSKTDYGNNQLLVRCFDGTMTDVGENTHENSVLKITSDYLTLYDSAMSGAKVMYPLVPNINNRFFHNGSGNSWPSKVRTSTNQEDYPYLKIVIHN